MNLRSTLPKSHDLIKLSGAFGVLNMFKVHMLTTKCAGDDFLIDLKSSNSSPSIPIS